MIPRSAAVLLWALTLTLAACGDDGGDAGTARSSPSTTPAPTTTTIDPEAAVEAAAHAFVEAVFDWDGATIDEDFDAILAFATGPFEEEARATFQDEAIRDGLRENQASERVTSAEVHIESFEGDRASVFAVVEVAAINSSVPRPRQDVVRAQIGFVLVDGDWKVEDFNVLDGLSLGLPEES